MLAVLGVAEAELILAAADAIATATAAARSRPASGSRAPAATSRQFARDLLAHLRQLLVIRTAGEVADAFTVTAAEPERLRAQAERVHRPRRSARAIDVIAAALAAIREGDEPRMTVELALLRAARPQLDPPGRRCCERIERLEAALGGEGRGCRSDPAPDSGRRRRPSGRAVARCRRRRADSPPRQDAARARAPGAERRR